MVEIENSFILSRMCFEHIEVQVQKNESKLCDKIGIPSAIINPNHFKWKRLESNIRITIKLLQGPDNISFLITYTKIKVQKSTAEVQGTCWVEWWQKLFIYCQKVLEFINIWSFFQGYMEQRNNCSEFYK